MATSCLLRSLHGAAIGRALGRQVFPRCTTTALVPRKTFTVTSVNHKRLYGPEEDHEKKDDVHHWKNERYVAVALLPIIPTAIAFPNVYMDMILTSAVVLHCHWRLSGVAQDYIHGETLPTILKYTVLAASITVFGSLCYFNYSDVGLGNAINMIYSQL